MRRLPSELHNTIEEIIAFDSQSGAGLKRKCLQRCGNVVCKTEQARKLLLSADTSNHNHPGRKIELFESLRARQTKIISIFVASWVNSWFIFQLLSDKS